MITFKGNPMEDFLNNSYKIFWRKQGCKKFWKNRCKKLEKTARIIVTLHEKKKQSQNTTGWIFSKNEILEEGDEHFLKKFLFLFSGELPKE